MLLTTLLLSTFLLQTPQPLTCEDIVGGLYIQSTQQQRESQRRINELSQQLAALQAEITKLKEAK